MVHSGHLRELIAALVGAVLFALMTITHVRNGRMGGEGSRGISVIKDEEPDRFWAVIAAEVFVVLMCLGFATVRAIQLITEQK